MSAAIIQHFSGETIANPSAYCASLNWSSADLTTMQRHRDNVTHPGQLWERVATQRPAATVRLGNALTEAMRRQGWGYDWERARGALISAHPGDGFGATGGIIRAGQRIR